MVTYRKAGKCNKGERTIGKAGAYRKCSSKAKITGGAALKGRCPKGSRTLAKRTNSRGEVRRICGIKR